MTEQELPLLCEVCGAKPAKIYREAFRHLEPPNDKREPCEYCAMANGYEYIGKVKVGWIIAAVAKRVVDTMEGRVVDD